MKKHLLALFGLGLLLATASAYAQSIIVKANVPFDFVVNGKTLTAGEYRIGSMDSGGDVMSIRAEDRNATMLALLHSCGSLEASSRTKLVFHRYKDRYFLAQVWVKGDTSGRELAVSPLETELALDYPVEQVVLMAQAR